MPEHLCPFGKFDTDWSGLDLTQSPYDLSVGLQITSVTSFRTRRARATTLVRTEGRNNTNKLEVGKFSAFYDYPTSRCG